MAPPVQLTLLDPRYPSRLRNIERPPASIMVSGGTIEAARTVAIVGSRAATPGAKRFAHELAAMLAAADVVVVSGGAHGVDEAAHRGAMSSNGRTWVVAGTGHKRCFPKKNRALFDEIAQGPGAMIWPFGEAFSAPSAFLTRNRYLVGMSDAVVVVQAGQPSGALNAAVWAQRTSKPLWVVAAAPWLRRFDGSGRLLDEGALPLRSFAPLFESLGLRAQIRPRSDCGADALPGAPALQPPPPLSDHESATLRATSPKPRHTDAIAEDAGLSPQATTAALLTLALENVLVEGPPGFFRRRDGHNR